MGSWLFSGILAGLGISVIHEERKPGEIPAFLFIVSGIVLIVSGFLAARSAMRRPVKYRCLMCDEVESRRKHLRRIANVSRR